MRPIGSEALRDPSRAPDAIGVVVDEAAHNDDSAVEGAAWAALEQVIDPELGLPITDLGLVYEVSVTDGDLHVEMTTTTPICPLGEYLTGQAKTALAGIKGAGTVEIVLTQEPPWTPDRLSERARRQLGHVG